MRIAKTRKVVKIVQLVLFYTQLTKSTEKMMLNEYLIYKECDWLFLELMNHKIHSEIRFTDTKT